jgi:hypothetical protein
VTDGWTKPGVDATAALSPLRTQRSR